MKTFFVYILRCSLAEHKNKQGGVYTSLRLPVQMVFSQSFADENEAYAVEQQVKGWSRKKKEALIANNWNLIIELSNQKRNILRQAQDE